MRTFDEVVPGAFALVDGRWVFRFGEPAVLEGPERDLDEPGRYSLELEPIIGGGWLVALYDHHDRDELPMGSYPRLLLPDKIPVRAVIRGDGGGSAPDVALAAALRLLNHSAQEADPSPPEEGV